MHNYPNHQLMSEHQILEKAAEIILTKFIDRDAFTDVNSSKQFLTFKTIRTNSLNTKNFSGEPWIAPLFIQGS